MILFFSVDKQMITRTDNEHVVQDSQNYLYAQFEFSEEWTGQITAVFKGKDGTAYNVLLDSTGQCLVPWEVLTQISFDVSVFCGDLITANVVRIFTIESGYEIGQESRVPTPDIYTQIIEKIEEIEEQGVDPEAVERIVDEYLQDKDFVTEEDVETIVATYVTEHHDELKGDTGPQGPQGERGPQGETGPIGPQGPQGDAGAQGPQGPQGIQGETGATGPKGDTGETPIISATATVTNTTGTPAVNVTKSGTDEAPAFNFAFSGIKGETGSQGPQGIQGPQGPQGEAGEDGSVVTVTPILQSGTKIAEIDVDGTTEEIFAPSGGSGGASALDDLTDVEITTPTNGEVLAYDGAEWKNENANVSFIHNDNLLVIPDGEYSADTLNISIKDNIITLNTTSATTKKIYIKLTNGVALKTDSAQYSWRSETVSFMEAGKTYGIRDFSFGGASYDKGMVASVRDSAGASILSKARTNPVQISASPAYIQLFVEASSIFVDYKVGVAITENKVPEDWGNIVAYHDYWKQYISQAFLDTENFINIGPVTGYVTQGMCTDGTYLYTCLVNSADDSANTYVYKYNLSDGTLVTSVNSYSLGHCNSMTYCPKDGYIYCIGLDTAGTVHVIDSTDLSYVGSKAIDLSGVYSAYTGIGAISYNASRDVFVCLIRGDRKGYAIVDRKGDLLDLVWTRAFYTMEGYQYTPGSCFADDFFIYQVSYLYNGVQIFTYNGDYVGNVILPSAMYRFEPEDISIEGDYMYISIQQSNAPHVMKLSIYDKRYACILKR